MDSKQKKQQQQQPQKQGGGGGNKNKRSFQTFSKSNPSPISDQIMKKIKRETDVLLVSKQAYLDSLNQQPNMKRFDISTNGKIKVSDYVQMLTPYLNTEGQVQKAHVHGKDKAIGKCISVCEVLKRTINGLKQETQIFSTSEANKEKDQPPIEQSHILITLYRQGDKMQEEKIQL